MRGHSMATKHVDLAGGVVHVHLYTRSFRHCWKAKVTNICNKCAV